MRWIAVLIALWLSPLGLLNEPSPEDSDSTTVSEVRDGKCPGGTCPKRPRPRPKR